MLFEDNPNPMWIYDLETFAFLAVNNAAIAKYGFSREEFLRLTIKDIFFDEDINKPLERVVEGFKKSGIWRHRKKDGSLIEVEIASQSIFYDGRKAQLVLATDVSENIQIRRRLQASEEQFRLFADNIDDVVWISDVETGQLIYLNPAFERIWGLPASLVLDGKLDFMQTIHKEDRERIKRAFAIPPDQRKGCTEYRIVRPDGSIRWIRDKAFWMTGSEGKYLRIAGIAEDITEWKTAELTLRLLGTALESTANAVVITDSEGNIQWVNTAFTRLTGYSAEEVIGKNPRIFKSGFQSADFYRNLWNTILEGKEWRGELKNKRKDGSLYYEELSITPLLDSQGNITNFIAIKQDVTQRKLDEERLLQSQAELAAAQRLANIGNWRYYFDTGEVQWSEELYRIFGRTKEEFGNDYRSFIECVHPDDRSRIEQADREMITNARAVDLEYRIVLPNGQTKFIREFAYPFSDNYGRVQGLFGISQDVSDYKSIEAELLRTKTSLEDAQAIARLGSWELDLQSQTSYWSKEMYVLYGRDSSQGAPSIEEYIELVDPADRVKVLDFHRQAIESGEAVSFEVRINQKDASDCTFYVRLHPVKDQQGTVVRLVATHQDITEQKRREIALQTSEALLRAAQRAARLGTWQWDLRTNQITLSDELYEIFGVVKPEQFNVENIWDLIHPDDRLRVRQIATQTTFESESLQIDFRAFTPGGLEKYLVINSHSITDDENKVVSRFGTVQDITDRVLAEKARQEKERAEIANQTKNEFLSRVSHELRTPLNAILGFAQLLELDLTDASQRENVQYILSAGKHLLQLINEILDISRIEAGRLSLSLESVSVLDLLDECIQLSRPMAEGRGIKFVLNNTADFKTPVLADRQRLSQVFLNLLSNAIKYNREGGKVTLDCSLLPGIFRVNIRDTGFGIAPEMMSRLFTPFDRLGVQDVEGTGLGLVLSKRLVEAMGGRLGVDSVVNQGSNFWVELPQAQKSEDKPEQSSDNPSIPGSLSTKRFSVLYVEDNLSNLRLVEHILMRFGSPDVITTMQGSLGLELAREHRPDLILLDLHLPDMHGKDVLLRLKSDVRTRDIPVVILSADASPQHVEYVLAQGASAYLIKPLEVSHLIDVLSKTLS